MTKKIKITKANSDFFVKNGKKSHNWVINMKFAHKNQHHLFVHKYDVLITI